MSTFRDAASIRPDIWIVCRPCKRALHLDPCDPLIADRDMTVGFRCQKCGAISRAQFADPRWPEEHPQWTVEDRTARLNEPSF